MFASPAAYADELLPSNAEQAAPPTEIIAIRDLLPYFGYYQGTAPFNLVDDSNNIVGSFDLTRTIFTAWLGLTTNYVHGVISDGAGTGAAWDGAVSDSFQLAAISPVGPSGFTIIGNDYLQTPEGMSDYLTLFGSAFPLFDTFAADQASTTAAAVAQLAGDTSDPSNWFGSDSVDAGWLADLGQLLDLGNLL